MRKLSLISPPAIGIRPEAPNLIPFSISESAAMLRVVCKARTPDNNVNDSPVTQRTSDFKKLEIPEKFISLHKTFIVFTVKITFIKGIIIEHDMSSIMEIERLPAVDEALAVRVAPDEA